MPFTREHAVTWLLLLGGTTLMAQPLLDEATSKPSLGTTYSRETYRLTANVPTLPTTGGPITWDLSGNNFSHFGVEDTCVFVDPSATPFASDFPLATACMHTYRTNPGTSGLRQWRYSAFSGDSCAYIGFASTTGSPVVIDPIVFNTPLPLNHQDTWNSPDTSVVFTYSAYGTIIAPWGDTIPDVVMIEWGLTSSPWYAWHSADNLQDMLGSYDPVIDLLDIVRRLPVSTTSVHELSALSIQMAPNPASGSVQVQSRESAQGTLRLFDNTGRTVLAQPYRTDRISLDIHGMEPGCYLLRMDDDQGRFGTTRLVVQ